MTFFSMKFPWLKLFTLERFERSSKTAAFCLAAVLAAALTPETARGQLTLPGASQEVEAPEAEAVPPAAEDLSEIEQAGAELEQIEGQLAILKEAFSEAREDMEAARRHFIDADDTSDLADIDVDLLSRVGVLKLIEEQHARVEQEKKTIQTLDLLLNGLIQAPARVPELEQELEQRQTAARLARENAQQPGPSDGPLDSDGDGQIDEHVTLEDLQLRIAERKLELTRFLIENNELLYELATTSREFLRNTVNRRESVISAALERQNRWRVEEARRSLDEARAIRSDTRHEPDVVKRLADEVVELNEESAKLSVRIGEITNQLQGIRTRLDQIKSDFETTRRRVEVVGHTPAIGRLLRRRLENMPSLAGYHRGADQRRGEINESIDRQIDVDETLRQLGDVDEEVDALMDHAFEREDIAHVSRIRQRISELYTQKLDGLSHMNAQHGALAARLTELDQAERGLVEESADFARYVSGELMTVRSQHSLHSVPAADWQQAFGILTNAEGWSRLAGESRAIVAERADAVLAILAGAVILLLLRRPARAGLAHTAQRTRKVQTDSMGLTIAAIGYTLILASLWPLILGGIGWLLQHTHNSALAVSLGKAMGRAGLVLFILLSVAVMVRPDGLARQHFRWSAETCERIARNLAWFIPVAVTAIFLMRFLFESGVPELKLLSRLPSLVYLALIAVFFWRVLSQGNDGQSTPGSRMEALTDPLAKRRTRWLGIILLIVIINAGMSYVGYHYTAMRMDYFYGWTIALLIGLLFLYNLLLRWSTLTQRRLRFNEIVKRRQQARLADSTHEVDHPDSETEEDLDVEGMGEQTRRLISGLLFFVGLAGLYIIWDELLPVLSALDKVALPFSHVVTQAGVETEVPVTLTDLLFSLLVFVATFFAAKNLPGLLEFLLLQRLPIDAGARYATITIARYLIVAIGVIAAFNIIGADWSQVQWLIAALSVGLGFGLQEIVANFVSGIIILFERPIRVGDVITLDNVDGTVSKIRIRATTIRNWDQKELIVPNKDFITGRLLNWTLTDSVNRLVIPVGIAYGSNVDEALKILLETASGHEEVMTEPHPVVIFEGFGASSLDLTLRCYLKDLDGRLAIMSELNGEINRRFAEAGIEVPFAQRDVHLRSGQPLEVVLRNSGPEPEGA